VTAVNILVVDDRRENLTALVALLEAPDRKLFTASSGREALELVLKHDFALALLDVEMPVMDGYETAQLLRGTKRTRLVPIIFITAGDITEESAFRGYESGAIDFLFKPINAHMLESKVRLFVELHRRTRELEQTTAKLRERIADLEYVHQTLSDDLRAPLRAVRTFTQVVIESAPDLDATASDAIARVARAGARMTTMIDDLYSLLRLSAENAEPARIDLESLFEPEILEAIRGEIQTSGAVVKHETLPKVVANRHLVVRTMQNLIANAIRFRGDAAPAIEVGAKRVADAWKLSVSDNGVGIAASDQGRLFKLFGRLDQVRSGSGVGLALCARAVEKLGGKIWLEASSPQGSTFSFTLPDH
jgi:signal transduction histidine kinase